MKSVCYCILLVISSRSKQLDAKLKASKRYGQSSKDTTNWLDTMEHKVTQLQEVSHDIITLNTQIEQVKVSL